MNWIMVYNGAITNLYGEDRDEAIEAMDDDEKFDAWRVRFERKRARETSKAKGPRVSELERQAYEKRREWRPPT